MCTKVYIALVAKVALVLCPSNVVTSNATTLRGREAGTALAALAVLTTTRGENDEKMKKKKTTTTED